jgi:hypothetical protein
MIAANKPIYNPKLESKIQPIPYGMSQDFRDKKSMQNKIGIGVGILVLIGLIMVGRKYPKATIGIIAILYLYAFIFVGFWGPSRYQQWINKDKYNKTKAIVAK